MKDYTMRANVVRFWPIWVRDFLCKPGGADKAIDVLKRGKVTMIDRKDRLGLIQRIEAYKEVNPANVSDMWRKIDPGQVPQ